MKLIRQLWHDTTGATLSEYALALCIITVATVAAIQLFSAPIGDTFARSSSNLAAK